MTVHIYLKEVEGILSEDGVNTTDTVGVGHAVQLVGLPDNLRRGVENNGRGGQRRKVWDLHGHEIREMDHASSVHYLWVERRDDELSGVEGLVGLAS